MPAPGGQPSDSHIHLDPAIHPQDSGNPLVATAFDGCERALALLENLQSRQRRLPHCAALAWERATFAQVFDHPGPRARIQRFLDGA